jgi:hypothetical protein
MMLQSVVWNLIANAIENSSDVREALDFSDKPMQLYVGHDAGAELEKIDAPVISISPMDQGVDFGHFARSRDIPVLVRFSLSDNEVTDDGVRKTFRGMISLDKLANAILTAMQSIDGLGDELTKADVYLEPTENFPLCSGRIECVFNCVRGLAFEPSVTEV